MKNSRRAVIPIFFALLLLAYFLPFMAGTASAHPVNTPYAGHTHTYDCPVPAGSTDVDCTSATVAGDGVGSVKIRTDLNGSSYRIILQSVTAGQVSTTGVCWKWTEPLLLSGLSQGTLLSSIASSPSPGQSFAPINSSTDQKILDGIWWIPTTNDQSGGCTLPPPAALDPPPDPEEACSRTLTQNNGNNVATFRGNVTTITGASDTFSWDFGDASTDAPTEDVQHIYAAIGSMPDKGWTATLTITRTGDGTLYDPSPIVVTCSLRVDFINPTLSTPLSTDIDDGEDSDCPSGWGWLNPAAIVNVLKCLFIPSNATADSLQNIFDEATTKAPFSVLYDASTFLPAIVADVQEGVEEGSGCITIQPNSVLTDAGGANTGVDGDWCPTQDEWVLNWQLMKAGLTFIWVALLGLALYRSTVRIIS